MNRLFVVNPSAASYREGLYDRLRLELGDENIHLQVVGHSSPPSIAQRDDSIEAPWVVEGSVRWVTVAGKEIALRDHGRLHFGPRDLVLVQQALKNLDTYSLMARQRVGGPSVAMWGHGQTYSTPQSAMAKRAKMHLTRRADWFFAYTALGARYVNERGFPRERTTILWNTLDTHALTADLDKVTESQADSFRREHKLTTGRTALFLGGVDPAKGIDFLLSAATITGRLLPGFTLLIGGSGDSLNAVRRAESTGSPVRALGRLDGEQKALALSVSDVLAIPEWIGLVAVDSLVAGRPIVSTRHHSHSPEAEYLEPGRTAVFTDHNPQAYAEGLVGLLTSPDLPPMQQRCLDDAPKYDIDGMEDRFVEGILAWQEYARTR